MTRDESVCLALRRAWGVPAIALSPLAGGMTSCTWLVDAGPARQVAKLVPAGQRAQFEAGLAAAEHLQAHGIRAGRPVRAADGALVTTVDRAGEAGGGVLALLEHVPGRPLDGGDPVDQQWWGDLLGRAHRALRDFHHPGLTRWHWLRPDAGHLRLEPWLRPAVTAAVAELTHLTVTDLLTYGVLHGDPAPDAFRIDAATGRSGLIDWGSAGTGPLMYDVASAVMYAGGPKAATELLDGYAAAGPVPQHEIEAALPTLLRFRWAVQADWFARRIVTGDTTGTDPDGNLRGLRDARDALAGL